LRLRWRLHLLLLRRRLGRRLYLALLSPLLSRRRWRLDLLLLRRRLGRLHLTLLWLLLSRLYRWRLNLTLLSSLLSRRARPLRLFLFILFLIYLRRLGDKHAIKWRGVR
jgi:hypothetical protein